MKKLTQYQQGCLRLLLDIHKDDEVMQKVILHKFKTESDEALAEFVKSIFDLKRAKEVLEETLTESQKKKRKQILKKKREGVAVEGSHLRYIKGGQKSVTGIPVTEQGDKND